MQSSQSTKLVCIASHADLLPRPSEVVRPSTQILYGRLVVRVGAYGEYARVRNCLDQKLYWVRDLASRFAPLHVVREPTHRVCRVQALGFLRADLRSPLAMVFPYNALVRVAGYITRKGGRYAKVMIPSGKVWVRDFELSPIGKLPESEDFVKDALGFTGRPHQLGGLACDPGIDSSGFLHQVLLPYDIDCPRDGREQARVLGEQVSSTLESFVPLRGDLVFFGGHVAIMVDGRRCVHATSQRPYSGVVVQDICQVLAERERAGKGGVTAIRRLPNYSFGREE